MKLSDFDYALDESAIALYPADPPDTSRLLVLSGAKAHDARFLDLPSQLRRGDILVFNDTKVIPARLFGTRGEAKVEVTLHKAEVGEKGQAGLEWACFVKNAKRLKPGQMVTFADTFEAEVLEKREGGEVLLRFAGNADGFLSALSQHGVMPLPPYIASKRPVTARDAADYQSLFAAKPGAVAAPTASLHFTERVMTALANAGIGHEIVTLHVGAGTFLPVKVDNIAEHQIHSEYGEVSADVAARLNAAKAKGCRIIAVGTTALRVLEAASARGELSAFAGDTDLFITPGYRFRTIDGLITNFHLPKSTLLMLVSALMGRERVLAAYTHALKSGYRFFSYGDACLMVPEAPQK
ncbi:MAG: tRNA preQ1(34) S-adenosylmethionine ribosyltransferase-isomerase QueA [Pseudomonadota bacterium]